MRQKSLLTQHTPMEVVRARRNARESRLGPNLDAMPPEELLALCNYLFPQWPRAFGKRFTLETACQDVVIRRLLLFALEQSSQAAGAA